jgi:hypothetical protein
MIEQVGAADYINHSVGIYMAINAYPLQGGDRLGGSHIDFPIAVCYGDRDFFGSKGED